jgi:tetratricopeptide (TPR) repeat protein
MSSGLLRRTEDAEHEFECALLEGRVDDAADLAVTLARRRLHGVGSSLARVERVLAAGGLELTARIPLVRELAMLHSRAGRFSAAFEAMTEALSLAQEAGQLGQVCEAEIRGAFFAVQVGELAAAQSLLDNAESHAAELGDDMRLGFVRVVRGVASLSAGDAEAAVELMSDGLTRVEEADPFDRSFLLRQLARAFARAGRHESAIRPLAVALASSIERHDDVQLAECLETFAALELDEVAALALGAAPAFRERAESMRWADESRETQATLASVRSRVGDARAADLAAQGHRDPDGVARRALARLT